MIQDNAETVLKKLYKDIQNDCEWESFEAFSVSMKRKFSLFVNRTGSSNVVLNKVNVNAPHSKQNSRFSTKETKPTSSNSKYRDLYVMETRRGLIQWMSTELKLPNVEIAEIMNIDTASISRLLKRDGVVNGKTLRTLKSLYEE